MPAPVPNSDARSSQREAGPAFYRADLLLLLPFLWQLGLAPIANGMEWRPFGLPFPMIWQMLGILFATGVIALRYRLDSRDDRERTDAGEPR